MTIKITHPLKLDGYPITDSTWITHCGESRIDYRWYLKHADTGNAIGLFCIMKDSPTRTTVQLTLTVNGFAGVVTSEIPLQELRDMLKLLEHFRTMALHLK